MNSRRSFLTGLAGTIICAPAIVRVSSLMKLPTRMQAGVYYPVYGLSRGTIRDLLMPGLVGLVGKYESIPTQWENCFVRNADNSVSLTI